MTPICSVLVVRYYFGPPFVLVAFLTPVNDNGALNNNGVLRPFVSPEREREREASSGGDFLLRSIF